MNADGTGPTNLTNHAAADFQPAWGPALNPPTRAQCMNGGWATFGFENQGQCVRYVETGKDSRIGE